MASASTALNCRSRLNSQKAHFQQTVCLADWWLVKAAHGVQGRGLAVAGFTFDGKRAMRVFSSAPILRRYDVFTVETTDGICVVLDGFMNKDRTLENGFPSDVCKYFVFGFPSYWKEYYEKFVETDSSSKDISANLLENQSPHSGNAGQTHTKSHEKDFLSHGKMNAKAIQESKKTKSSAVPLPQRYGSVNGGSEDNLKNKIKLVSDSSYEGTINVSAVIDKDVEYSQINDNRGILSACHTYQTRKRAAEKNDSTKAAAGKNDSAKANFEHNMSFSEDVFSCNEVGARTCGMSSLKMKMKNQTSASLSGSEKIWFTSASSTSPEKVKSTTVDRRPGSGNNWNFEVTGLNRNTYEMNLRLSDAGSVKRGFDQVLETPNQDKGMRKIRTSRNTQKEKATKSLHTPAAADNQMDKKIAGTNSLSEKAKASTIETRRKLAYDSKETSDTGKKVPSTSPQPLSLNRSRSGRLLMPTLEFWRNQIPVYDEGRKVTGIEGIECAPFEQPKTGSGSTSQRSRRERKKPI